MRRAKAKGFLSIIQSENCKRGDVGEGAHAHRRADRLIGDPFRFAIEWAVLEREDFGWKCQCLLKRTMRRVVSSLLLLDSVNRKRQIHEALPAQVLLYFL